MAHASMNALKGRIKSVKSTMQITKTMELVSTSKLRRAREKVLRVRPFLDALSDTAASLLGSDGAMTSPYLAPRTGGVTLLIPVAGDRGLAGGYNQNVFRLCATVAEEDSLYLPIGKKALEYYRHRGVSVFSDAYGDVEDFGVGCAMHLAEEILRAFVAGTFSRVVLVYTEFTSMMTQTPKLLELLPLAIAENAKAPEIEIYEDVEELLERVLPDYLGGVLYSAVCEAVASENGARRSAMNAANKNAGEMIENLSLHYNRARQAAITQEITEIVSGAEAL